MSESFADVLKSSNDLLARPVAPRPDLSQRTGVAGAGVLSDSGLRQRMGLPPATGFGFIDDLTKTFGSANLVRQNQLAKTAQDGALKRQARAAAARALAQSQYPDADEKALNVATRLNMGEGRATFDARTLSDRMAAIRRDASLNGPNDPYAGIGDPRLNGTEQVERDVAGSDMRRALTSGLGRTIQAMRANDPYAAQSALRSSLVFGGAGQTYRAAAKLADPFTGGTMAMTLANARNADGTPYSQTQRQEMEEMFGQGAINAATLGLSAATGTMFEGASAAKALMGVEHGLSAVDLGLGSAQVGSILADPTRDPGERTGAAISAGLMAALMSPALAGKLLKAPQAMRAAEAARLVPELEGVHPGAFTDSILGAIKRGADPRDVSMLIGRDLDRATFDARRAAQVGASVERSDTLGMRQDPQSGRWSTTEGAFDPTTGNVSVREDATSAAGTTHELQHRIERDAGLGSDALRQLLGPDGWKALQDATYADAFKRARGEGVVDAGAKEYGRYYSSDEETARYWIGRYMEDGAKGVRGAGKGSAQRAATKALAALMDEKGIGAHGGAMLDFDRAAAHGLAGGAGFDAEGKSLYDPIDRARAAADGRAQERADRVDVAQTGGTAEQRERVGAPELVRGAHDGKGFVGLTPEETARLDAIDAEHDAAGRKVYATQQLADEHRAAAGQARDAARARVLEDARFREANDRKGALGQEPLTKETEGGRKVRQEAEKTAGRALGGVVVGEGDSFTPDGKTKVPVRVKVVDRSELVVSHDGAGAANPDYPAFAQPRDRSLPGERAKVDQQARDLNPDLLLSDFKATDRGAPVVGSDGVVESGNGRVLTLDRAKEINPEGYRAYVDALVAKHPEAKGIKDPVLVQERVGDVDHATRSKIAGASNESSSSAMNAVETAKQDAARLPEGIGERFEMKGRSVEDSLDSVNNRQLLDHFVRNLPETERASMFDTDGGFSVQAKSRFARALAAKALGPEAADMLYRIHLEGDVLQRTVRGLELASPDLLKMRAAADGGNDVARDMGSALVQALRYADEARSKMGGKAGEWFEQGALSGMRDPDAMRIGKMLVESPNQEQTAELVRSLARAASDSSGGMFGEDMAFKDVREAVDSLFGDRAIAPDVQRSVSFDGDEFAPHGEALTPLEFRDRARDALRAAVASRVGDRRWGTQGRTVPHPEIGPIEVTMKEARGHWLQEDTSEWKKRLAPHVMDALLDARYVGEDPLTKPATRDKQKIHILENEVTIGGETKMVHFIVRENVQGQLVLRDVQEHTEKRGAVPAERRNGPTAQDPIVPPGGASGGDTQRSTSFDGPYRSKARDVVEEKAPKRATVGQIVATLKGAGVKEEEIRTQLGSLLDDPSRKITKDELAAHMDANAVQVKEVLKGAPDAAPYKNFNAFAREKGAVGEAAYEDWDNRGPIRQEWEKANADRRNAEAGAQPTRYNQYTLPDRSTTQYGELLLTLPEKGYRPDELRVNHDESTASAWFVESADNGFTVPKSKAATEEEAIRYVAENKKVEGAKYQSSHWDEPNVLAHTRFQTVPAPGGGKALLIEEIQSDWHQDGRKKGYRPDQESRLDELVSKRDALPEGADRTAAQYEIDRHAMREPGVPDAPFRKTWHELALRRMVKWAADRGMDRIAWPEGQVHADRYDLANDVSRIEYYPSRQELVGYDKAGYPTHQSTVAPEKLGDVIGKDPAQRLLASEKTPSGMHAIEGDDLKVGGEGMRGFYDKILVDYANRYGKRFGSKVETMDVPTSLNVVKAHSLPITPEMAQAAKEGVPLWSRSFDGGPEPAPGGRAEKRSAIARILDRLGSKRIGKDEPGTPVSEPPRVTQEKNSSLPPNDKGPSSSGEPPVPEGHVRLYHGGHLYDGAGPRFVTPNRGYAEGWASRDPGMKVQYVDVPEDSPHLRPAYDDAGTGQKAPVAHFNAPEEIASKLKPIDGEAINSGARTTTSEPGQPALFDGMDLPRRDRFELSEEQRAQDAIGDHARQADVADRGEKRGVEFQGKTYRSWDEARRLGSVLNDRTDILSHLGKKDPGAGISDVERTAAMQELGDVDARLDAIDRSAAEARDAGDHRRADDLEAQGEELRSRYADLAGKVMDLTSDNGRNLAATRMFVDRAGGDVQRNLRRARAEARRQLTASERRKVSDAARAIGALTEAVDKERARALAHAEDSLGGWKGKTVTLKDLGKAKQRSASGAVAEPRLDPVEALTRIAQNIAALGGVDPADLQGYARDRLGIHLDDDAAAELMRWGGERHANPKPDTPEAKKLDDAKKRLEKLHADVKETTARQFVEGLYRGGLLSTLRAAQASLGGNALSRVMEDAARVPATMIDAALSLRTGERTVSVAGTIAGERAAYSLNAAKASLDAVVHGASGGEIGKYDQARTIDYKPTKGKLPAVDAPFRAVSWGVNKVFDLLAAADRPAWRGEMERALIEQATLDAKNKGLKGEDVRTYVRSKLGANVAPEIVLRAAMAQSDAKPGGLRDLVKRAKEQAEESILANDSPATKAAAAIGQIPVAGPLFLPFPKIPTNAVARGMEWSPAGVVYGLARTLQTLHGGDVAAQKKAANALARGALGSTVLLYLGYKAREFGYISGPSSSDQGMRATEEAAGQQGSSVKVGSRWLSYRDVPQMMVVGIGAALYDAQHAAKVQGKDWKPGDTASALMGGAADSAMDLPTLQGAKDATQALQEVSRAKGDGDDPIAALRDTKLVQGLGGSLLPRGEQEAVTGGDPYQREASSFAERFQAGTSGRTRLARKVDALGRPLERTTGILSQVRGLSPDQSDREKDALAQELLRLRVPMTPPQKVRKEDRVDRDRDSADFAERKERIGTALASELRRLMATTFYRNATDAQRREEILAVRKEARSDAAADLRDERERSRK